MAADIGPVLVVIAAAFVLSSLALLLDAARRGSDFAWALATTEAIVLALATIPGVYVAVWLFDVRCFERCAESSSGEVPRGAAWHVTDHGWQWTGQLAATLVGMIAAVALVVLIGKSRYREAFVSAAVGVAAFGAWAAFLAPFGDRFGI